MSLKTEALSDIDATRMFFDRTTRVLDEADASFRATPETMTVVGQVAHVAQSIDWFREGALEDRWRTDWEAMAAELGKVETLAAARAWVDEAWGRLRAAIEAMPEKKLAEPIPANPILPSRPRAYVVTGIADHTAHHRGSLAVYARLLGKVPPMPYGDD
jgi:uncharacterized damage-inducible protein DinB